MVKVVNESQLYGFGEHAKLRHGSLTHRHRLIINDVKKNDSGEYMFGLHMCETCENSDLPGVMLAVTGNTLDCLLCKSTVCKITLLISLHTTVNSLDYLVEKKF